METSLWSIPSSPHPLTSSEILEKTLSNVAPLPSQKEYAKALSSIFSIHLRKNMLIDEGMSPDELPTPSAVVIAPTGQGKTFLLRKMAEILDQNVITIDAATLASETYKGVSLSQRLSGARKEAKDKKAFEQSILFIDEVDKLISQREGNGVMSLLQLFNGGKVALSTRETSAEYLDVSRFTILLGGAFVGLEQITNERLSPKVKIGFGCDVGASLSKPDFLNSVIAEDLVTYGLPPELVGRIGTILTIPQLGFEDYHQLLNAESGSIQKRYNNFLKNSYGVSLEITPACVEIVAKKCMKAGTGARAVNPLVNDLMRNAIMEVENDNTICKILLDAKDEECCVRYECGTRMYAYQDPGRKNTTVLPRNVIFAKTTNSLVRKLCRYYWEGGGNPDSMNELEAFLQCAVPFLHTKCKPVDFCFASLEKFARVTYCPSPDETSPFEIVMADAQFDTTEQFRRYEKTKNQWIEKHLVQALRVIMSYIQEKNGPCCVVFSVPPKKSSYK